MLSQQDAGGRARRGPRHRQPRPRLRGEHRAHRRRHRPDPAVDAHRLRPQPGHVRPAGLATPAHAVRPLHRAARPDRRGRDRRRAPPWAEPPRRTSTCPTASTSGSISTPARDELFISKPVLGRGTGKSTRAVHPQADRPGRHVSPAWCWFRSAATSCRGSTTRSSSASGFVLLAGTDGVLRARGPCAKARSAPTSAEATPFTASSRTAKPATAPTGAPAAGTAFERIVSFRRLPDLPLVVLVGFDTDAVFQAFRISAPARCWIGAVPPTSCCCWACSGSRCAGAGSFEAAAAADVRQHQPGHRRWWMPTAEASVMNRRALQLLDLPQETLQRPRRSPGRRLPRSAGPTPPTGQPASLST